MTPFMHTYHVLLGKFAGNCHQVIPHLCNTIAIVGLAVVSSNIRIIDNRAWCSKVLEDMQAILIPRTELFRQTW